MMQDRGGSILTYSASGVAIVGGLTLNDWAAIIGITTAVLSFAYNVWHKREVRKIVRTKGSLEDM